MRKARCRKRHGAERWGVRARVERFSEPAILLLLRERPAHGYELLEQLRALGGGDRVDMGNVYRALRALEEEGVVSSAWDESAPGPSKRTYELTGAGHRLLDEWADALARAQEQIARFLTRYRDGEEVKHAST